MVNEITATMPGKRYHKIINEATTAKPIRPAFKPLAKASLPSVAPMVSLAIKWIVQFAKAKKGKADAVVGGWGLGATAASLGPDASSGLIAIQDAQNTSPKAPPNFKTVSFADIEKRLSID